MKYIKRIIGMMLCLFIVGCASITVGETPEAVEPTPEIVILPTATPEPTPYVPVKSALGLSEDLEGFIEQAAEYYNLPSDLVRAVIWVESRGVTTADNGLCVGLMQLNRDYADTFMQATGALNITEPRYNIVCGCWWLSELLEWADGEEDLALMAYNLGQSKARKNWNNGVVTSYAVNVQNARSKF